MMRPDAKRDSYRLLADALARLGHRDWRLVVVGDGAAAAEVRALLAPFGEVVRFTGALDEEELPPLYAACDLYVWPAVAEAYGMTFLEAQAAGLPVLAGDEGGVPDIVADGVTGRLAPRRDPAAFAAILADLLARPDERAAPRPRRRSPDRRAPRAPHRAPASRRRPRPGPAQPGGARRGGPALRVCLIRHGSTVWNEEGRIQGRTDIPLSDAGRVQVAAWRLPDGFTDAPCWSSPLRRARETAALLGFPDAATDWRLAEMRWGSFEGRRLAELRDELGDDLADSERRGLDFRPPDGETPREVAARLASFLQDLAGGEGDRLLVAHKGVLRAALVLSLGWDMLGRPPAPYDPERALLLELDPEGRPRFLASLPLRPESA